MIYITFFEKFYLTPVNFSDKDCFNQEVLLERFVKLLVLLSTAIITIYGCGKSNSKKFIVVKNFTVVPDHSSLFGNIKIEIFSESFPAGITSVKVTIAGKPLYNLQYSGGKIEGYVEGNEKPGRFDIKVFTNRGNFLLPTAFKYEPLRYPAFRKMVAVGASYTHGFISMGLEWNLQLYSPFAQVAKQAGAYFPQALVVKGILPPQDIRTFFQKCTDTSVTQFPIRRIMRTFRLLKSSNHNLFTLATYRVDPYLQVYNAGIGGATIQDTVEGATKGRIPALAVLENLSYNPFTDIYFAFSDPPQGSPFKYAVSLHPTILFSTDLYADDILEFALMDGTPSLSSITPVSTVKRELQKMFTIMKENNIMGFIANMPDITMMPLVKKMKDALLQKGYSEEDVNKWWKGLKSISAQYSMAFTEEAKKFDNIHIVDFRGYLEKMKKSRENGESYKMEGGIIIRDGGVVIGNQIFTNDFLDGLVSLDAVHLTYTGYALIADMFIATVNKDLGYDIPYIDLEKIAEIDPLNPETLKKEGFDMDECRRRYWGE